MRWLPLLFIVLTAAGCGSEPPPLSTAAQKKEIVVLTRDSLAAYFADGAGSASGLEHDLAQQFAEEIGRPVRFEVARNEKEILSRLLAGEADLAAGWLTMPIDSPLRSSRPYLYTHHVLVQREDELPVADVATLAGRTVHVLKGSHEIETLRRLQRQMPTLRIVEEPDWSELDLLEAVADERIDLAVADSHLLGMATNFLPELATFLELPPQQDICWIFPAAGDDQLFARAAAYLDRISGDGTLTRLQDRYFGHIRRLTQQDVISFLESMQTDLPPLKKQLQAAQVRSGIDWRLLAALAYQESRWDAAATSPTGVRGIMMLTEETADRLGVGNRLDAAESLPAGARYLADLRDELPADLREPDRTWFALAAYNLGMGHLNAARTLATVLGSDANSWYEMKKVLPLLARPQYYARLKSGKARGGEAVIMVENIRSYFDILARYEPPYVPFVRKAKAAATARPATVPGLRAPADGARSTGLRRPAPPETADSAAIIPPVP